jgi:hypothetical protein
MIFGRNGRADEAPRETIDTGGVDSLITLKKIESPSLQEIPRFGAPPGTRTLDTLIKSQVLAWNLSNLLINKGNTLINHRFNTLIIA